MGDDRTLPGMRGSTVSGVSMPIRPFRFMAVFREAEREAREAGWGLWATTDTTIQTAIAMTRDPARVWANTASRVYHCPGTRYYGSTTQGRYQSEAEAQAAGFRPALGGGGVAKWSALD